MISTAPPFVLRLSKDERKVFQRNPKADLTPFLPCRQSKTIEEITPKPPPTKAWVSVKVMLEDARKLVDVTKAENSTVANSPSPLVGVIGPQSLFSRLKKYFWRDVSRVPMSGGIEWDPRKEYTILVRGRDASCINFCENFL